MDPGISTDVILPTLLVKTESLFEEFVRLGVQKSCLRPSSTMPAASARASARICSRCSSARFQRLPARSQAGGPAGSDKPALGDGG